MGEYYHVKVLFLWWQKEKPDFRRESGGKSTQVTQKPNRLMEVWSQHLAPGPLPCELCPRLRLRQSWMLCEIVIPGSWATTSSLLLGRSWQNRTTHSDNWFFNSVYGVQSWDLSRKWLDSSQWRTPWVAGFFFPNVLHFILPSKFPRSKSNFLLCSFFQMLSLENCGGHWNISHDGKKKWGEAVHSCAEEGGHED